MDTFGRPVGKRARSNSWRFSAIDFDEEGCEVVEVSGVRSRSVALFELFRRILYVRAVSFRRVGSDVDSCGSGVSVVAVVSGLLFASRDTDVCPDEFWGKRIC